MRRVWIGFGFVLVAAVGAGLSASRTIGQPPGGADKDANHRKVTVTGTGTVLVKPDVARLSFAVKATGMDYKSAVAECDKKGEAVEKAIADLKLGGIEIKKGPILLTRMNASNVFQFVQPPVPVRPPMPPMVPAAPGVPARPGPLVGPAAKEVDLAFVGQVPDVVPVQPVPQPAPNPPLLVQPVPAPQPGPGFGQPFPGQPFPGPGPFPGMPGGPVEVSRSYTVIATFGAPGMAGELADVVKVTDKLQATVVGAGGTESPQFLGAQQMGFGANPGNGSAVLKIEFHRANLASVRQEATKLAVADAVANAKAAAGVANLTTKDVVAISDQNQLGGNPFGMAGTPAATGRGEVLGEMEITVQVSVTFSY